MSMGRLILFPAVEHALPQAPDALETRLRDTGLLGRAFPVAQGSSFLTGEQFLSLITFLGCSPAIELTPTDPPGAGLENLCHIRLHGPLPRPILMLGGNSVTPRCPVCRNPLSVDPAVAGRGDAVPELLCEACGQTTPASALNWRRSAAWGRYFLEIRGIYPSEAVPTDALLGILEDHCGFPWRYAYLYDAG